MDAQRPFLQIPNTNLLRQGIFSLIASALICVPLITTYMKGPPAMLEKLPSGNAAFPEEIVRGDTTKKQVTFTFDAGEGAQSADSILQVLAKHKTKGTFFLTGKFIERNPDLVRRMVALGHEIYSHTYDHPHLTQLTDGEILDEFKKMEEVLYKTAGISPKPYFRPPYGDRDDRVLRAAFKAGYESIYWSIDGRDWEETLGTNAADVRARILNNLAPGNIYLMHVGDTITGTILDDVFTEIENRGYTLVSLTQGL